MYLKANLDLNIMDSKINLRDNKYTNIVKYDSGMELTKRAT